MQTNINFQTTTATMTTVTVTTLPTRSPRLSPTTSSPNTGTGKRFWSNFKSDESIDNGVVVDFLDFPFNPFVPM